jgi:hypothetical protein
MSLSVPLTFFLSSMTSKYVSRHILSHEGKYCTKLQGRYFSLPKTITTRTTKIEVITLHWINSIIRNNKCIFTRLNAVFILKTYNFICSKFYKLYKYNINISHNKTMGLRNNFNNSNVAPWRRKFSRLNVLLIVMFTTLWYSYII